MKNGPLRFVTAASLFDGHDVSINIMRRILQDNGVEVIHLGHNRSAFEIANCALSEDAHAVAISSYQGGHNEFFPYVRKLLDEGGGENIKIFGGGGGVIAPDEVDFLHQSGIEKIYTPEDGMKLGLQGIIEDMINRADFDILENFNEKTLDLKERRKISAEGKILYTPREISKFISFIEKTGSIPDFIKKSNNINSNGILLKSSVPVLGITGTGGAGKSSLIDELLVRLNHFFPAVKVALISIDPTRRKTQGALLGDRIRMGMAHFSQYFVRSLATRDSSTEISNHLGNILEFLKSQDFNFIIVETSGIGQSSYEITKHTDKFLYVMTPEYGAPTQLEKIEMLEWAHFVAINKFDRMNSEEALRDVRKQYRRIHKLFIDTVKDEELPIFGTSASQFNDLGITSLFWQLMEALGVEKDSENLQIKLMAGKKYKRNLKKLSPIIAGERSHYLRIISQQAKIYHQEIKDQCELLKKYQNLDETKKFYLTQSSQSQSHSHTQDRENNKKLVDLIEGDLNALRKKLGEEVFEEIEKFETIRESYFVKDLKDDDVNFEDNFNQKKLTQNYKFKSLSGTLISRVSVPKFEHLNDIYRFIKTQNLPGFFPYSAGVFQFKRRDEDPKRMFAGEGNPLRTNSRFHFLSKNDSAKRLSTAFDSVTLYGEDPHHRPDIFGKIGESGVSICNLDDMVDLFKGFNLTDKNTSVSMTINGPSAIILAMFMNTAFLQNLSKEEIDDSSDLSKKIECMKKIRGTVQADMLKEDQAQNTCIFSLEFALRLMGDVQEFFGKNVIKNYYTISISGYHIAEAGANPITQLAFTLANGFTYVEYFLSRGLHIDEICPNLSFFFSNGLDPEYSVLGRCARKIWAYAIKFVYKGNESSQKLKYHVQTSGRSLHAQEIDFNDIRTTLQALLALSENCNSLHTNAFDEAITTPTYESVRRAMAIQLIIGKEYGPGQTENYFQGSFINDELAELVEDAVYREFERISDKGGVLGAMETMYQRGAIQEQSHYYESLKDSGGMPIIGVNTFFSEETKKDNLKMELIRATYEEKEGQIKRLNEFKKRNASKRDLYLSRLREVVLRNENVFQELLETVKYCSLGEITNLLYEVGGKYRRNI
jgi:methylmalonyl-CoA mutase